MTGIHVVSADDRPSRQEQIEQLCALIEAGGSIKLRILPQLYDASSFQYAGLRDAQWTLTIPKAALTPDAVEGILEAVDTCLRAIGEHGAGAVAAVVADMRTS